MYSTNKNICFPLLLILLLTFLYVAVILKNFQSTTIEKSEDMPEPITTELDIGIGHVLVTCRSNDVTSLEVTLLEVTSLTNDVGHLPVTSSYVTYYYYNYYLK